MCASFPYSTFYWVTTSRPVTVLPACRTDTRYTPEPTRRPVAAVHA